MARERVEQLGQRRIDGERRRRRSLHVLFGTLKLDGSAFARNDWMTSRRLPSFEKWNDGRVVLVQSRDALGAALLGALVETLGYTVRFSQPRETPMDSFRRSRARVALIDREDPVAFSDDTLGRAAMLRICVIIFCSAGALERIRALALEHDFETLLMPPEIDELEEVLERAMGRS